jgi:hypothetical protein
MGILTTIAKSRHTIDFGVTTTHEEREVVLAQRFRVYQREGYYRKASPRTATSPMTAALVRRCQSTGAPLR